MANLTRQVIIAGYAIDATVNEDHDFMSEVSQYPIESGDTGSISVVTDNVIEKPVRITIEAIVSDTPMGRTLASREQEALSINGPQDFGTPTQTCLEYLLRIRGRREPITIETSLRKFESVVLESLSVPRDAETGEALRFRATFVEVLLVTNQKTTLKTAKPNGKKKRVLGNAAATVASAALAATALTTAGAVIPGAAIIAIASAPQKRQGNNYLDKRYP